MNPSCYSLIIDVANLDAAVAEYSCLLRTSPAVLGADKALFAITGVHIELHRAITETAVIRQLILAGDAIESSSLLGFQFTNEASLPAASDIRLDLVVFMVHDFQLVSELLAAQPYALEARKVIVINDHETRLAFYNLSTTTLELAENPTLEAGSSNFWGLGYYVEDIDAYCQYLLDSGVDVSPIRPGQKRNTRVASIKSHHLGLPTLLVGPA